MKCSSVYNLGGIDETSYLWDARNIVLETVNSTPETVYTLEPEEYGNLISQRQGATSYFFHDDAQGSTANLTDSTATEENAYTYDAWGTIEAQSGTVDNPFTYVGRQGYYRDEATARYLVRRRQYEAGIGRFLSADPEGFDAGDDNLYRYVGNDPVNGVDPSGLTRIKCIYGNARNSSTTSRIVDCNRLASDCCEENAPSTFWIFQDFEIIGPSPPADLNSPRDYIEWERSRKSDPLFTARKCEGFQWEYGDRWTIDGKSIQLSPEQVDLLNRALCNEKCENYIPDRLAFWREDLVSAHAKVEAEIRILEESKRQASSVTPEGSDPIASARRKRAYYREYYQHVEEKFGNFTFLAEAIATLGAGLLRRAGAKLAREAAEKAVREAAEEVLDRAGRKAAQEATEKLRREAAEEAAENAGNQAGRLREVGLFASIGL